MTKYKHPKFCNNCDRYLHIRQPTCLSCGSN